jgi:hypothetical protein
MAHSEFTSGNAENIEFFGVLPDKQEVAISPAEYEEIRRGHILDVTSRVPSPAPSNHEPLNAYRSQLNEFSQQFAPPAPITPSMESSSPSESSEISTKRAGLRVGDVLPSGKTLTETGIFDAGAIAAYMAHRDSEAGKTAPPQPSTPPIALAAPSHLDGAPQIRELATKAPVRNPHVEAVSHMSTEVVQNQQGIVEHGSAQLAQPDLDNVGLSVFDQNTPGRKAVVIPPLPDAMGSEISMDRAGNYLKSNWREITALVGAAVLTTILLNQHDSSPPEPNSQVPAHTTHKATNAAGSLTRTKPEVDKLPQSSLAAIESLAKSLPTPTEEALLTTPAETEPVPTPSATQTVVPPMLVRVATLNVLGASHTSSGGKAAELDSGKARMDKTVKYLDMNGIAAGALQEFEPSQDDEFRKVGDRYGLFHPSKGNAVFWDKEEFSKVNAYAVKVPYFDGNKVDMPVVQLRYKTGQEIFVISFHNPADTQRFHNQEKYRDEATRIEKQLVKDLYEKHKIPVIIAGDANERDEFFCKMTENGILVSAKGGSNGPDQKCISPNTGIDQILGVGVNFSNFQRDEWPIEHGASDHPYVSAQVLVPSSIGGQNG